MTESQLMREIFLNNVPLIDVRAEVEFEQGAFPTAFNIPILNTDERHRVGISYKEKGPEEAEKLGHELVSGEERRIRISRWSEFIDDHEKPFL
jgi:tRNA 2-selenouridine synthase